MDLIPSNTRRVVARSLPAALLLIFGLLTLPVCSIAATSVIDEPGDGAYNIVSHYQVSIDAPEEVVWAQLLDLKSWMYEFELTTVAGHRGQAGEVLRLYEEQDFLIQLVMLIPNELLVMVNLPSTFQGEYSTGSGVISLYRLAGKTMVELTMSRRYTWMGEGINDQRSIRESEASIQNTDEMWQDRFLDMLRCLS